MTDRTPQPRREHGMSLVELMVALAMSLIVIAAVGGVYLSSSRSYSQDELLSRMQENARYALQVLAEDLSMAGYWGPLVSADDINTTVRDCTEEAATVECHGYFAGSVLSLAADADGNFCGPGTVGLDDDWALSIQAPVEVARDVTATSVAALFACIDPSEVVENTDILAVKRAGSASLSSDRDSSADDGSIFFRTNGLSAMLHTYHTAADASEGSNSFDWAYQPRIYYIRDHFLAADDGIPTLARKGLSGNVMTGTDGGVAHGIERFRILFGVDTSGDAVANYYSDAPAVSDLSRITSARIYVLARSVAPDHSYNNDKTYRLGPDDIARTYDDSFYRRVFSTTVALRNPRNRISVMPGN